MHYAFTRAEFFFPIKTLTSLTQPDPGCLRQHLSWCQEAWCLAQGQPFMVGVLHQGCSEAARWTHSGPAGYGAVSPVYEETAVCATLPGAFAMVTYYPTKAEWERGRPGERKGKNENHWLQRWRSGDVGTGKPGTTALELCVLGHGPQIWANSFFFCSFLSSWLASFLIPKVSCLPLAKEPKELF